MLAPEVIESAERRVGETLSGKWHLDRVIGVGGMAAVYEATHRNRNRVAIKLLHAALSLDEGTRHRFLREGYVANTIRHEGAVQILDDEVTETGVAFLVMELLRGESVDERMVRKGGALEIHEALSIADQLLDVLGTAHDQNVVHRDIKPDNIFLTESGRLKVLDFGIARLHQGDRGATKVGSFMGTPAFVAPEQARGRWDEVDHRTDLFSVGATLFTCLTGSHVHEAETSSEQLALAISASARSLADALPGAPADLVELVDISLSYDKEERFQSARAMRAAVQRVRAGLPQELGSAPRLLAAPVAGGVTLGPAEVPGDPDPDSLLPSNFPQNPRTMRVLMGLLAAGVLAVLLLVATQAGTSAQASKAPSDVSATSASSKEEPTQAAASSAKPEVLPPAAPAPVEEAPEPAQPAEVAKSTPIVIAPRPKPRKAPPSVRATQTQKKPPIPAPTSKGSLPSTGSDPDPSGADDDPGDIFDTRF